MAQATTPVPRGIAACLAAIAVLFGLDALLFRTPLYPSILEPGSSAGLFEMTFRRERQAQALNGDNLIVTLGNSRFAYLPRLANEWTSKTGYVFRSAGAAGSDPRAWYYMLRDLDPGANRYRAVVFGVDDYDDEDTFEEHDDDIRALHFAIARLRLTDAVDFASSFPTWTHRWEAFRGALFKGFVLQRDIQAFLSNPRKRLEDVEINDRGFEDWTYNYNEDPRTLAGLQIDWASRKVTFPPGADQIQRDTVNVSLMRSAAPQTGHFANFQRRWYGRMIDLYRGSRTRIVFVRLPRGPVVRPDSLVQKKSATIRDFARLPNVLLCDEHAFDSLERPELFKDAVHLNRDGCARFSAMLAAEVGRVLGR